MDYIKHIPKGASTLCAIVIFSFFSSPLDIFATEDDSSSSSDEIEFELEFEDVSSDYLYKSEIKFVHDEGFASGFSSGLFMPENNITRAEFIKILIKSKFDDSLIAGCHERVLDDSFPDVSEDNVFSDYICIAKEYKIVKGYPNGDFGPNDFINFPQVSKVLTRALTDTDFSEEADVFAYVDYLQSLGLIPPTIEDNNELLDRGEMAYLIKKFKVEYSYLDDSFGSMDPSSIDLTGVISASEAIAIAQGVTNEESFWKVELEYENGVLVYEVKLGTYEVKVDAITGTVVEIELDDDNSDSDDSDDDDDDNSGSDSDDSDDDDDDDSGSSK
ncbi:S-layer homology domain-containing protein [Candidatus Dojkabacteria bacterium]|uniref:S-layer homology domain-containing protein n=1 Tax=Candidatus Dojkabacteria bacterium TaxID=2099670 RepID=A0A955RKK9_9BACT|nr:S-layer homology domain-containing protein [Candidatus Dojkabacteria bacterium]